MKNLSKLQILAIVVACIVAIFMAGAISRITNCNFYNIVNEGIDEVIVNLNYEKTLETLNVELSDDEIEDILNIISKYDYDWTYKSFFGISTSISGSSDEDVDGEIDLMYINTMGDGKIKDSIALLTNGELRVGNTNYKMDSDKARTLVNEVSSYVNANLVG